jgi:TolA-binding protein
MPMTERQARIHQRRTLYTSCVVIIAAAISLVGPVACNLQSGKNHYVLAERLFNDKKYSAAVEEFSKVLSSDPRGGLAQQSLFRIAMIQFLYLESYGDAAKHFRQFIKISPNSDLVFQAEKTLAEIYYAKLDAFVQAADLYENLYRKYPTSLERDFFLFRAAKSQYGALNFDKAILSFHELLKLYPKSRWAPEALYQIGNTYFTKGDCDEAIEQFQEVLLSYPKTEQAVFAQFGMGNCYEEQERPEDAIRMYERVVDRHPSPGVVRSKLTRLKDRAKKQFQ